MLVATHLRKVFGSHVAVDQLDFSLRQGELFGFLGPNGAGKTTTIKMLVGLLRPTHGTIMVGPYDLQKEPLLAKKLIGYVPDKPMLYDRLTGREFIRFMAELYEMPRESLSIAEHFYALFDMQPVIDELISGYSHGMKQKISLIGQLVHRPKVILLDEPTVGLDPKGARVLHNTLKELCAQGASILISTHLLPIAEMMCDRVGIMDQGKLIALGTLSELQSTYHTDANLEDLFLRLTSGEKGEDM